MSQGLKTSRHQIVLLVLAAALACAASANDRTPPLVTDRPDQTESSDTVPQGLVQLEFGWTHVKDDDNGDHSADSLPETLVRVGVAEKLELRLGFQGYVWQDTDATTADGAGDLEIGLKWRLWEELGWTPKTALLAGTTLPTGAAAFSSERFDPSVRLACSHTLSETFSLAYNLAANWATEEDATGDRDTTASVAYTVALGIGLSDQLGTFIEFFGEAPTGVGQGANSIDGGFTYLLADNLQVDILSGVGISDEAEDWFAGAGVVWRLPH